MKELPNDVEALKAIIYQQALQIEQLQQQVETLLRQLYGKRSERQPKAKPGNTRAKVKNTNHLQYQVAHHLGRQHLPEHLVRERIEHDIPEDKRPCPSCGHMLHRMGEVTSEQLSYVPAQIIVKEHVRLKYACRHCQGQVTIAPAVVQPIDKGLADASLLAEVAIAKYEDALPLYRQEKRWQRLGISLSRSTQCHWIKQIAQRLEPLVERMQQHLLQSAKLHTDDTPLPVLAKGKTHTGRFWVYMNNDETLSTPCVVYEYTPSRSQSAPQAFLAGYKGYLQADAYAGYDSLYRQGDIIEVGCWAHARRKFYDISQAVEGHTLADDALEWIGKLYALEHQAKPLTGELRKYYRRHYAKPLLKQFRQWLLKQQKQTLPKAPIGQAIAYTLNHWQALTNYCREGYLNIDNNAAERAIKPLVIGRKNWLFGGSHAGAAHGAILFSLIETCKLLGINTFAYLKDVLNRLPTQLMKDIDELLPYNWQALPEAP